MSAISLGVIIRRQRQLLNWSQQELADRIGGSVDQAVVSRLENGQIADPGSKLMFHLARALNVSPVDLLSLLVEGDSSSDAASAPDTSEDERKIADLRSQIFKFSAELGALEEKVKVTSGNKR